MSLDGLITYNTRGGNKGLMSLAFRGYTWKVYILQELLVIVGVNALSQLKIKNYMVYIRSTWVMGDNGYNS